MVSVNSEFENESVKASGAVSLTPIENVSGGSCYAYTARLSGKKVFVKEIKPEFADDTRMQAAFRKEAEIGFRLEHPNLPKYIFAEGILPPDRYIVQEFIDGRTLPEFLNENPGYFEKRENVDKFIRELADVIDYLHANQIVHLDIKPENIIISRIGNSLKLVDLGFCATDFYDDTRGFTSRHIAPEGELRPQERGAESDYYGLGKMLEFISGRTTRFPERKYRNLKRRLLLDDPARRLASKEGVEKFLKRNPNISLAWGAAFIVVAALIGVTVFLAERRPTVEPDTNESVNSIVPENAIETEGNTMERPGVVNSGNTSESQALIHPGPSESDLNISEETGKKIPLQNEIDKESFKASLEPMKKEMALNIRKNFSGFDDMLSRYLQEGKFSESDKQEVMNIFVEKMRKSFDTEAYKMRYKNFSSSVIDDTFAEVFKEEEKKGWDQNFQKYEEECQRFSSESSR